MRLAATEPEKQGKRKMLSEIEKLGGGNKLEEKF
jgi:hypothetical protein